FKCLFFKCLSKRNISYRKKIILLSPRVYEYLRWLKGVKNENNV
ncbi:glycosyltransferase family 2 protein, partial [Vibrio anguillarum]|nr:glycosyltransferase family 2 protein [Vibrio anguillarum]